MTFTKGASLAQGQIPAILGNLYSPPALSAAYIKKVRLANPTAGTVTFSLYKRIVATDYLMCNVSLLANEWAEWTDLVLGDGEVLRGVASVAASITFIVEGVIEL